MSRETCQETWLLLDSRDIGGIETHVLHLACALQVHWGKVRVVFLKKYGEHPLTDKLNEAQIPWEYLSGSAYQLFKALSHKPKLLHTHGYKSGIVGRVLAKGMNLPVVSTFHAGEPGQGKVRFYNFIDNLTAGFGEAIAVSEKIQSRVLSATHLIPNFVPMPQNQQSKKSSSVAFVGRLSPEKGPDLFCEIAKQNPNLNFMIYGDGPMRDALENEFGDNVHFAGQVPSMEQYWADIGLLCMPSRYEGLPYAALEAMANGIPVAAFDVGSLAQAITHNVNGWIAPPKDTEALSHYIHGWANMDNQDRKQMSLYAREAIKSKYSPEVIIPQIIEIYSKAIVGGRSC
ncbi:MAG: glycosyltransferase [Rhodospirillaceae bacterium]|nr:MAG: glycosyltransferase [Rhodospirillaceae bacterium]